MLRQYRQANMGAPAQFWGGTKVGEASLHSGSPIPVHLFSLFSWLLYLVKTLQHASLLQPPIISAGRGWLSHSEPPPPFSLLNAVIPGVGGVCCSRTHP